MYVHASSSSMVTCRICLYYLFIFFLKGKHTHTSQKEASGGYNESINPCCYGARNIIQLTLITLCHLMVSFRDIIIHVYTIQSMTFFDAYLQTQFFLGGGGGGGGGEATSTFRTRGCKILGVSRVLVICL